MDNIRTSKLFNSLERKQPAFVVISVFPTRITGVEKAIEPLGKSDKRLRAAFNLPKKMPRIRVAWWEGPVTGGKLDVFFNRDVLPMQQQ